MTSEPLLEVKNLKVHFSSKKMFKEPMTVHAVDGVNFSIEKGKTLGIVGESGSGKTTTALAVLRLVSITEGEITLSGKKISHLEKEELRLARRHFQMIFQDPYSSLDPRCRVGDIVREPLDLMNIGEPDQRDQKVKDLFEQVGLRPESITLFPHQFSGGQRQRVGLARALATEPDLIVCDEPVSALDVAVQAQILNVMRRLQEKMGLTYLFISHDLGVVQHLCDDVAVMYLGQIVEKADRKTLFTNPKHPYTKALLAAVPRVHANPEAVRRSALTGDPPSPINLPKGCRFAGRCPVAIESCASVPPPLKDWGDGHFASCHLLT
ncbi:ABC transporter ATP-binding protein [Sneathiella aquimaris]|uniref:ABC transporter ATP-binding protein n=1 Tax=Sneathiella aquimaris TaxID=2599305 RepID=UPI00146F6480|nr:ABC transporter ATP-binding protein [Sneathiella aquimaris]